MKLLLGDCIEQLKNIEDNSVDAVITDPPYELGFMGKSWDNTGIANNKEMWAECLRVLKPGGHLLAFSGTRTYHRMASAIEDAGFEVRDMIEWVYGSGFPKSLNIGKAVDKLQGNEREVVGQSRNGSNSLMGGLSGTETTTIQDVTKGTSEWEGWGTALKPAHEPICMARKPLAEKSVAENCLKWGTGGINIDESRVGTEGARNNGSSMKSDIYGEYSPTEKIDYGMGRFPANLIHDNSEEVRECFPESGGGKRTTSFHKPSENTCMSGANLGHTTVSNIGDSGNASRFFKSIIYQAKASKSERNNGLDCYVTVKYNISTLTQTLCKEENMVAVQLLQKVISEQELVNFYIDESGENIMVQCHKDFLYIILTKTRQIIESKILNLLMHSLTSEYTQVANSEMENGGNLAESVESLKTWILTITKEKMESALGVSRVVYQMLHIISEEGNWKEKTNIHSTVKPIALMEYLINMVSRDGSTILDPFMGSGSTGVACVNLNRDFIGIERDADYMKIAEARILSLKK